MGWEEKNWEKGQGTYLVDGGTLEVGIPHNIERKYVRKSFIHLLEHYRHLRHLPDTLKHLPVIPQLLDTPGSG